MKFSVLLILALGASFASADQVKLQFLSSGATAKLGGYMPQRLALTNAKPDGLKKAPEATGASFGVIDLAGTKTIVMLAGDKLYVDTNGNGDLTDDGAAEWKPSKRGDYTMYMGTAKAGLTIEGRRVPAGLGVYKFDPADPQRAALKDTLLFYSDYALEGKITLGGKTYNAMVSDMGAAGFKPKPIETMPDGRKSPSGVNFMIDVNGNGKFDRRGESYDVLAPFNIGGTTYEISSLSPAGFNVAKSTQTVAEVLPPPDLSAGKKAVAFNTKATDGSAINFPTTYKGKVVMLDFWATWCGPCKGEIPGLVRAYDKFHGQGFEVLGISLDNAETAKGLAQFTKEWNMPWTQVCDAKFWQAEVAQLYVVDSIPAAFLVDGDTGEILASGNDLRGEALVPTLERALAKKKAGGR